MAIAPGPLKQPEGMYIVTRVKDTPEEREDAKRQLINNGCKSFRFDVNEVGQLRVHGWLVEQ